jgi:hypothetical protein
MSGYVEMNANRDRKFPYNRHLIDIDHLDNLKASQPVRNNYSNERWQRADRVAQDRAKLMRLAASTRRTIHTRNRR